MTSLHTDNSADTTSTDTTTNTGGTTGTSGGNGNGVTASFTQEYAAFAKNRGLLTLWKNSLNAKIAPLNANSATCQLSIGIDDSFVDLLAVTFHYSGYYDISCVTLTGEVLEVLVNNQRDSDSVDYSLRGTRGIIGRTSEALYLQLKDYATKMPVHFAMEAL